MYINISLLFFLDPVFPFTRGPLRKIQIKVNAGSIPATLSVTSINGTMCDDDSGSSIEVLEFSNVNIIIGILSAGFHFSQRICGNVHFFIDIARHTEWFDKIAFSKF